jgi:hypothetical protein
MGASPTWMTNADKFAIIAAGGYFNLFASQPGRAIKYTSGTQVWDGDDLVASRATARANGWLLHDAYGNEIGYGGYSGNLLDNIGNVSFQNDFKQRALNFLALHPGVNGVYFDNFQMDIRNYNSAASYPVYDQNNNLLWSSNADLQNAEISFISNVGSALKAAGYVVGVNAKGFIPGNSASNDSTLSKQWMDRYAPYVSASMIEYWQQNGSDHRVFLSGGDAWYHQWDSWQSLESYAQSKGLEFWPVSYISKTELAQCRYLRGSYLLEWNGKGSIMISSWDGSDIWNSCTAVDVGLPSGAKYQVASGVWRRDFTGGYVIVNPTWSTVTVGSDTIPSGDAVLP